MYEIKVLSDKEFDNLPYPEMETSLGVADPTTRTAFVRDTGIPALTLFNAAHELEHLRDGHEGVHADHYRNGVYYKDFGDVVRQVAPMALNLIPGVGQGLSLAATAGNAAYDVNKANKARKSFSNQQSDMSQMMPQQASSPLEGFSAQKAPAHTIVPGQSGGASQPGPSGASSSFGQGSTPFERVRGFFSSRPAQGGF